MNILIIEKEKLLAETLKKQLSKIARKTTWIDNYAYAKYEILSNNYDVVILEPHFSSNPRDKQGLDLIKEIRSEENKIPIIVLTACDDCEVTSWDSLNAGADDFVKKPYVLKDLIARIKLAYRKTFQCTNNTRNVLLHRNLELNLDLAKLNIGKKSSVALGKINFLLLKKFMQYPYKLFSSEDLIEYLWGNSNLFNKSSFNALRVNISGLKNVLGKNSCYVKNRYGYGYVFDEEGVG